MPQNLSQSVVLQPLSIINNFIYFNVKNNTNSKLSTIINWLQKQSLLCLQRTILIILAYTVLRSDEVSGFLD